MATTATRNAVSKLAPIGRPHRPIPVYLTPSLSSSLQPSTSKQRAQPHSLLVPTQEVQIPRVFDIFDAPVHLRREHTVPTSDPLHSCSTLPLLSPEPRFSDVPPSKLQVTSAGRPRVSPLPQPILFDGPSRAPPSWHYPPPFDTPRVSITTPRASKATAGPTIATVQVFDGPSRPRRRRIPSSPRTNTADAVSRSQYCHAPLDSRASSHGTRRSLQAQSRSVLQLVLAS
ncbi:hypothetical protein BKA70DRAFT_90770 [Coprinopsis sp. MPI-PUGE-AT-0042]|nr:hypothetical protein BKA70DRAFT_90770 [Coprinopsis sp. MPI-PUGE-AT-0042]